MIRNLNIPENVISLACEVILHEGFLTFFFFFAKMWVQEKGGRRRRNWRRKEESKKKRKKRRRAVMGGRRKGTRHSPRDLKPNCQEIEHENAQHQLH